jgi:hypothetical protein
MTLASAMCCEKCQLPLSNVDTIKVTPLLLGCAKTVSEMHLFQPGSLLVERKQIPQVVVIAMSSRNPMEPLEAIRLPWAQGVGRSNRPAPTIESIGYRPISRAPAYQAGASVSLSQLNLYFALKRCVRTVSELSGDDANCRYSDQGAPFSISGPCVIAAVGNGDVQDDSSCQGDQRKLFQGRALVLVRTSRQTGPITVTARTPGLRDGSVMIEVTAVAERPETALSESAEKRTLRQRPRKLSDVLSGQGAALVDVGKLCAN